MSVSPSLPLWVCCLGSKDQCLPTKVRPSTQPAFHGPTSGHNHSTLTLSCCRTTCSCISGCSSREMSRGCGPYHSWRSLEPLLAIGWTGLRIAGRWCGIIASVLTATSAILVEKSLNARPYELSTFVVVLCAVVLIRWLEDSRTRWLWVFTLLALLATALQLFSLLAPLAMLASVLAVRPALFARRFRPLLAPVAVLAVASCAWLVACMGEVGQVELDRKPIDRSASSRRGPGPRRWAVL